MNDSAIARRLWVYQAERFPLLAHGPMVLVFCFAVLGFTPLESGGPSLPSWLELFGASVSVLLLFFQLRVADEFKDAVDDANYRPERAVPRGLISLDELGFFALGAGLLQLLVVLVIDVRLIILLVAVWAYMGLMTKEFFVPNWLKAHPAAYLVSHMMVMPLIAFYASAFSWIGTPGNPPPGIAWLMALSFFIGVVLEVGRKIKTADNERYGVETYSALWGQKRALAVWLTAAFIAAVCYVAVWICIGFATVCVAVAALIFASTLWIASRFLAGQCAATHIEAVSALLGVVFYLALTPLQLALVGAGL